VTSLYDVGFVVSGRLTHLNTPSFGNGSTPLSTTAAIKNVEATFDFVEATFDFVAKNGNNVKRVFREISSF